MKQTILFVCVILVVFALFSYDEVQPQERQKPKQKASQQPAKPAPDDSLTKTYNGLQITVIAVDRMKECQLTTDSMPFGPKLAAPAGRECAVVQLRIKALEKAKLDVSRIELHDVNGEKYKSGFISTSACDPDSGKEKACGIPISVPEGVRLKKLQIGDISFDLAKFERKK